MVLGRNGEKDTKTILFAEKYPFDVRMRNLDEEFKRDYDRGEKIPFECRARVGRFSQVQLEWWELS